MSHFHLSFKSFSVEGITYSLASYEPLQLLLLMAKYKQAKPLAEVAWPKSMLVVITVVSKDV